MIHQGGKEQLHHSRLSLGPATLDLNAMHAEPQFEETNIEGDVTSSDLVYDATLLNCALMTL